MPISVNNIDKALQELEEDLQKCREAILLEMMYAGEEAVKLQRGSHGYIDQTGNLTSSIGYIVLDHGKVVSMSNFESLQVDPDPVKGVKGGNGKSGSAAGKKLTKELAKRYATDDMALVIVAGMDYASHVEAKGLNVIDTAQLHIMGNLDARIKKRLQKAIARINAKIGK